MPFRPNPLTPFPAREGGNFSPPRLGEGPGERLTRHEWGPKRQRTLSQRGWANPGVQGAEPPGRGFGGCAPKNKKRGRVAHISKPATSGTQNPGEPSANEGGQTGGPGGGAPWQGVVGDVPPKTKRGGELPTLANPPRVGPKTPANPKPTRVGKLGVQGAKPPGRGLSYSFSPQN
jgi:hypothetical protein